jgi:hypothetical protein
VSEPRSHEQVATAASSAAEEQLGEDDAGSTGYVTLEAVGLTLIGVLVNIGVTIGIAIHGAWFVRVGVGVAAPLLLALAIKATHARAGAMKRLADWLTH